MKNTSDAVSRLILELSRLPGIGEKTATRLSYFILKQEVSFARNLSTAILNAKEQIKLCAECCNFTDINPCKICSDLNRDRDSLIIVEKPSDVLSIEQSGVHRGLYHVLHGILSPLDGIGPDELKIRELLQRFKNSLTHPREIILAMNPSVEGEATALYLLRLIKSLQLTDSLKITQLAHGLPVGGQLEYTDRQTIGKALMNRVEMQTA